MAPAPDYEDMTDRELQIQQLRLLTGLHVKMDERCLARHREFVVKLILGVSAVGAAIAGFIVAAFKVIEAIQGHS